MVKGSARPRAVRDGARRRVVRGLTAQGAELRAAAERKASGCARGIAQGARRCEMARGAPGGEKWWDSAKRRSERDGARRRV
eukprot:3273961-Pleurochrysis_carterae.AAC.1